MIAHDTALPSEETAALLLKQILDSIYMCFPSADIAIVTNEATANIVFSIGKERSVEVTEAFLDADDGITSALYTLADLRTHLRRLERSDVLMVTQHGLQMIPSGSRKVDAGCTGKSNDRKLDRLVRTAKRLPQ
jgi:hypothetical protein